MKCNRLLLPLVFFVLTTPLLAQSNSLSFAPAVSYLSGGEGVESVTVADVNGDRKPDLVVASGCCVGVLLGNGDGTFQTSVTNDSGGRLPESVAVADVNGDGKPDILVANVCSNTVPFPCLNGEGAVGVLLGNGDGTFRPAVSYASGGSTGGAYFLAVADVNGDGKPDILVANECSNTDCLGRVSVLLGNGDGTFQPAVSYSSSGKFAFSLAVGDVNGDGKLDVLVVNLCADDFCVNGSVGVLLGNGDGTFQPALSVRVGPDALSVTVGDVNGDSKLDLIVGADGPFAGLVNVLLGNGDGTFQPAMTFDSGGTNPWSVALGDVNGDGRLDVLVANRNVLSADRGTVGVLLGDGNGTFQPAMTFASGGFSTTSVTLGDVNGDGKPDVVVASDVGGAGVLINTTTSPYKAFVQQPLDPDGRSVFKTNRGVVPVKFTLTRNDVPTCTLPSATIAVTRTGGVTPGPVDESIYMTNADSGSNFRIDQNDCQYIYNLRASALGVGTYRIDIRIYGFVVGSAVFALK